MARQSPLPNLDDKEKQAISELTSSINSKWPSAKFILFGSKARGTWDSESDTDLLVILPCAVSDESRRLIIREVFDLNLNYGSNISIMIVSDAEWTSGPLSLLPIHDSILEEGIPV